MAMGRVSMRGGAKARGDPRRGPRTHVGWRNVPLGLLLALFLVACASEPAHPPAWIFPALPTPNVAPLPLTVGVHYPEAFLRKKHEERDDFNWYLHDPGGASAKLIENVLSASFKKVVPIPQWPPANPSDPGVDVIIVPRVQSLSRAHGFITYEIDFYTPQGVRSGTWVVHASADVSYFTGHEEFTSMVLRDAAAKLLIGFRARKEVAAHLPPDEPEPVVWETTQAKAQSIRMVLLPKKPDDEEWLSCIENRIRDGLPSVQFIPVDPFRDALFPWFEPSGEQPETREDWAKRLAQPLILQGAARMGVRYVLLVGGETVNGPMQGSFQCTAGAGAAGCFGFSTGTRDTGLQLTLADFARREWVGNIDIAESGEYTWIGLVLPIGFATMTETDACRKASEKALQLLEGR